MKKKSVSESGSHLGWDPLSETLFFFIDYHVYHRLERWNNAKLLRYQVYGESTFPFCATFRVNHFTSELDMQIEYDSLQFPQELIDAIADSYFRVYDAMMMNPAAKHHLFELIPSPPGDQMKAVRPQGGMCIHQWIEHQARVNPDAPAVVCGSETLS